jgi:hypothetical protein
VAILTAKSVSANGLRSEMFALCAALKQKHRKLTLWKKEFQVKILMMAH